MTVSDSLELIVARVAQLLNAFGASLTGLRVVLENVWWCIYSFYSFRFSWTVDKTIAGVLRCVLSKMAVMQLDTCVQNNYDNVIKHPREISSFEFCVALNFDYKVLREDCT